MSKVLKEYPAKILKEDGCPGSMINVLEHCIEDFIDNTVKISLNSKAKPPSKCLRAKDMMQRIENDLDEFFDKIIEANECGATIKVILTCNYIDVNALTKEYVLGLMWPDDEINDVYDDYVFNMNDFGYEYIEWNNKYYLVSGLSA